MKVRLLSVGINKEEIIEMIMLAEYKWLTLSKRVDWKLSNSGHCFISSNLTSIKHTVCLLKKYLLNICCAPRIVSDFEVRFRLILYACYFLHADVGWMQLHSKLNMIRHTHHAVHILERDQGP